MTDEQKQALSDYVQSLGLAYTATFQPKPQPRESVEYPQLHWLITLTKGARSMQVKYSEGCAHVKNYKQVHKTRYDKRAHDEQIRKTCETGKLYRPSVSGDFPPYITGDQPAPELLDVLYCLVSDASVLDYSSYEEWGPELGYDVDSRKGEAVYRECIKQSLALKNLIGYAALEKFKELFQDY